MPTQTIDTTEEADTGNEFLVHTKHTCDACFIRPIVGKRYTSATHPDFDLCSKCFCSYDEDKRGEFAETLLARDKAAKNSFFLKLKIVIGGEQDQTRRVNVSELWDSSITQLSFEMMKEISRKFVLAEMDGDEEENKKVMCSKKIKVTYIDEDGDVVNVTSDQELMDAFIQAVKKQPIRPFRITVSYGDKNIDGVDASSTPPQRRNMPNIAPIIGYARPNRGGRCGRRNLVIAAIANKEEAVAFKSSYKANKENGQTIEDLDSTGVLVPDSVFIHARHTCDVCHKTPIIGNRFHATKIADFDLCEGCFKAYDGDDLGFVPERLARDTQMQGMWLKKQLKKCSVRRELVDVLEESREIETSGKKIKSNTPSEKVGSKKTNMKGDQSVNQEACKPLDDSAESKETEANVTSLPFFIHARHTCDGCSSTPIIGTRYRATKIPDFDLCQKCFTSYEGEDLDFKPETLDIDRCMQPNWLTKLLASRGFDHVHASRPCQIFSRDASGIGPTSSQPCQGFSRANKANPSQGVSIAHFMNILEESVKAAQKANATNAASNSRKEADKSDEKPREPKIESDATAVAQSVTEDKTPGVNDTLAGEGSGDEKQEGNHEAPDSPNSKSAEESFLSDAEGHGSIAEVIGRTLDVCVQAMEEVLDDEMEQIKNLDKNEVAAIASAVADTYSVGSSMVSSVTDVLKKMDDSNFSNAGIQSVSGATIIESVDDKQAVADEEVQVEDASVGSSDDGWSVIGKKKSDQDEFASATEMIGSFLYNSGIMSCAEKGETNDIPVEVCASKEPISPVVLAKWDSELKQLNELGFTDERKNIDALERLEASHIGCDSTDKVTVNAAVDVLLGGK